MTQLTPTRLATGFVAGFLSVWIFSHGMIAILHPAGLVPITPWGMAPVPPFGVPQTVSAAFFGGLWGLVYALLEPKLTPRLGWWAGGLAFGVLPMLAFWLVVLPLKGVPIGGGTALATMLAVSLVLHAVFGLGVAIIYRLGLRLAGRSAVLAARSRR